MKSTRFWVALIAILLLASLVCAALVFKGGSGSIAVIYQDGEILRTIDLSTVNAPYSFKVKGPAGVNTVEVERGRIRVSRADCPDQICVHQGWISDSAAPIVCLPNSLVIQIKGGDDSGIDGVTG